MRGKQLSIWPLNQLHSSRFDWWFDVKVSSHELPETLRRLAGRGVLKLRFDCAEELLEVNHCDALAVPCIADKQHIDVTIHGAGSPSEEYTSTHGG